MTGYSRGTQFIAIAEETYAIWQGSMKTSYHYEAVKGHLRFCQYCSIVLLPKAVSLKNFQIHGVHTQTVKSTEATSMEIAVKYFVYCHMIMLTPSYYGAVSSK
jgi:hypothetical protein